jgi:hypothetical protein
VTPVQAPNANAYAEPWIRTVRAEWLDWLLITGRGHLEQVLRIYEEHYNGHCPHRALQLEPPDAPTGPIVISDNHCHVLRRDRLSGLLRPGIGEIHDDEPVVLTKHQVVGLKRAPCGLDRLGHDRDPVAWLLHGPSDGLALEGENTAYFDIAATLHQYTLGCLRHPLAEGCAHHSIDKRAEPCGPRL